MRFAFVLALVALTAGAERPERYGGRDMRSGGRGGVGTTPTYLEFAPSSGAGLPVISHHNTALCDALAAEVPTWSAAVDGGAGNWCLGGDGLAVGGSQVTFATFGSPTVIDTPVCPSGLDCLAATGQPVKALQLDGTAMGTRSGFIGSPPGSFSVCAWKHGAGSEGTVLARDGATRVFALDNYTATGVRFLVFKTGGANTTVGAAGVSQGNMSLLCGVYKYVADGSSELTAFFNGTAGTKSTVGVGPPAPAASQRITVGYGEVFSDYTAQNIFGSFYVDQELSASTIAAIARRVLADVPKAVIRGGQSYVDMTYTRTGSRFCARADNTGSIVPANRPCISQSGYLSEAAGTNLLLRSQEFDNAAWVKGPGATITSNHAAGPDSTKTAERAQFAATNSYVLQNSTTTAGPNVASVFLKGNGTSGITDSCLQNAGGTWVCTSCAFTPSAWSRCTVTTTTTTTAFWDIGSLTAINGGTARDAVDILLWGAQVETGSVATSYIPTTSAAASRGADLGYFVDPTPTINPARLSTALTASITSASGQYASFLRLAGSSYQTDTGGRGVWLYSDSSFGTTFRALSANNSGAAAAITGSIAPPTSPFRVIAYNDGSTLNFSMGATTATPGAFTPGAFENIKYIDIGNQQGSATLDSIGGRISKVCLDSRASRCR